jgi:hypothetical protein
MVDGTTTIAGGALRFDTRYGKAYFDKEFNAAFVFIEYIAYLRRKSRSGRLRSLACQAELLRELCRCADGQGIPGFG